MVVDPEQPGDPGNRDAPLAELDSLQCHRLINRGHDRIAKLNNQRQSGRGFASIAIASTTPNRA